MGGVHAHGGLPLCNCITYSGLGMETSFERLYGKEADLSHLKVIGAKGLIHVKDVKTLEPKS